MGYTTEFTGHVTVNPSLNEDEIKFLSKFSDTRRMKRKKGPYFVEGTGFAGQGRDADIIDYNRPPDGQPSLWCQWVPSADGTRIEWDGSEKFYDAEKWMSYLIDHFLCPDAFALENPKKERGLQGNHVVNGVIYAQGEDPDDKWTLVVNDNMVTSLKEHDIAGPKS